MQSPLRGSVSLGVLAAAALWAASGTPAAAGGLSLSLIVPGNADQPSIAVSVGQPGFYGQLTIGDLPAPPAVIYAQPVIVERTPAYVEPPIYLRVPPGYERHWAEHCAYYHACARRVYFVRDDWYNRVYVPHYRYEHEHEHFEDDHYRDHDDRSGDYRDHDYRDHEAREHDFRDHGPPHDRGRGHDRDDHDHDHGHGHDRD